MTKLARPPSTEEPKTKDMANDVLAFVARFWAITPHRMAEQMSLFREMTRTPRSVHHSLPLRMYHSLASLMIGMTCTSATI